MVFFDPIVSCHLEAKAPHGSSRHRSQILPSDNPNVQPSTVHRWLPATTDLGSVQWAWPRTPHPGHDQLP